MKLKLGCQFNKVNIIKRCKKVVTEINVLFNGNNTKIRQSEYILLK